MNNDDKVNAAGELRTEAAGPPAEGQKSAAWWRPVVLLAVVAAVLVLARVLGLGERLGALRDWIENLGAWGPAVYLLLYIIGVVAALPGSALTVAAGALFGSVLGVLLVSVASTAGAGLAFLISRYFARESTAGWLRGNEKFRRLDELTERRGAVIVALTRLVPIFPFNLLNYGFGLTSVPFWTYLFWSWLCMLPGTVLYVVGADAFFKAAAQGEVPWALLAAVLAAAVVLALLVRFARRRGIEIDTFTRYLKDVDRAITDGEERGLVKVHLKKGTDRIVGASIVARHAGEMIGEITLAMTAGIGLGRISGVIHPYPTQAEAIKQAADAYYRSKLTPTAARQFSSGLPCSASSADSRRFRSWRTSSWFAPRAAAAGWLLSRPLCSPPQDAGFPGDSGEPPCLTS